MYRKSRKKFLCLNLYIYVVSCDPHVVFTLIPCYVFQFSTVRGMWTVTFCHLLDILVTQFCFDYDKFSSVCFLFSCPRMFHVLAPYSFWKCEQLLVYDVWCCWLEKRPSNPYAFSPHFKTALLLIVQIIFLILTLGKRVSLMSKQSIMQ